MVRGAAVVCQILVENERKSTSVYLLVTWKHQTISKIIKTIQLGFSIALSSLSKNGRTVKQESYNQT